MVLSIDRQRLSLDGAFRLDAVLEAVEIARLNKELAADFQSGPGTRLFGQSSVVCLAGQGGALGRLAAELLGPGARAVRALAFDKRPDANWAVGWHQDRTIAVRVRIETPGFGPWSVKGGVPQNPPVDARRSCASPTQATFGFIERRSFTPHGHPRATAAGASCRSILQPLICPMDWNGRGSRRPFTPSPTFVLARRRRSAGRRALRPQP